MACYIKSSIDLLRRFLKETRWTSQLACNVLCLSVKNIKNTFLALELDPTEHTKER